jgi:hypothetical protein
VYCNHQVHIDFLIPCNFDYLRPCFRRDTLRDMGIFLLLQILFLGSEFLAALSSDFRVSRLLSHRCWHLELRITHISVNEFSHIHLACRRAVVYLGTVSVKYLS